MGFNGGGGGGARFVAADMDADELAEGAAVYGGGGAWLDIEGGGGGGAFLYAELTVAERIGGGATFDPYEPADDVDAEVLARPSVEPPCAALLAWTSLARS